MTMRSAFSLAILLLSAVMPGVCLAEATVFTTPHFVNPGEFALGVEPQIVFTNGAGVGINARYTQGISDLMNATAILGTGSGPRRFRVGGNLDFDFFPDISGQPGIGLATQALYYRLPDDGQLELTAIPFIHKTFPMEAGQEVEPYLGIPFGFGFRSGNYKVISNVSVGAMFKNTEHLRYDVELGVNLNNSESYFSGGVTYYH